MSVRHLLCKLLGHRWRMLGWTSTGYHHRLQSPDAIALTGWECDRCRLREEKRWNWN